MNATFTILMDIVSNVGMNAASDICMDIACMNIAYNI